MGIDVHCEVCGLIVEVDDDKEGQIYHCANCGEDCRVMRPYGEVASSVDIDEDVEEVEEAAEEVATGLRRSGLYALGHYGLRMLVVGAVLWVLWLVLVGPIYRFSEDVFKPRTETKIVRGQ